MQASIEQLKERLVSCLDEERNVTDMSGALEVLVCLENSPVTKETLEATRLGLVVNDIRKKCAQTHSDISKKCRNLIKEWQKLLSSSSTEGGSGAGGSTGSATSSPVVGGALTTPRSSTAAKLASVGLMCSPSPSLALVGGNRGKITPKLPNLANGNVRPNSNGNSPKLMSTDKNSAQIQSNSYAPSTSTGKGPSPLVLYSASSNILSENNNNGYNKPSSPATTSTSLKIRIKVGGGAESASIVKNVSDDVDSKSTSDLIDSDKKLTNGLNNNVIIDASVPSTSTASVVVQQKKQRQKRQFDQNSDSTADPLSMISKGAPLPKCKTTAALVAEMAREYPEEMAKSLTNATLEISPDLEDDIVVDRTFDSSSTNKRYSSATRRNSSDAYAKHDDYLDITKSEMVAHYLKTSIGEEDDDYSPTATANRAYSPTTPLGGVDQPRKRGRPRKNVDQHHYTSTIVVASSSGGGHGSFKTGKRSVTDVAAVDFSQTSMMTMTPAIKIKRNVNWYDILPPLTDNVHDDEASSNDAGGNLKNNEQYLDNFWPSGDQLSPMAAPLSVTSTAATASTSLTTNFDSGGGGTFPDLHSRILSSIRDRKVLAMPYVDIGLPDFFEYRYPDSDRFIAHWSER